MTDINIGAISEALNNKVDLPTPSTPQDAVDYVVEKQDPTSANGYTWYRKYKSGWVEQGGHIDGGVDAYYTVNLPLAMSDVKYSITLGVGGKMLVVALIVVTATKQQHHSRLYSITAERVATTMVVGKSAVMQHK